jgi:hypothetical protein
MNEDIKIVYEKFNKDINNLVLNNTDIKKALKSTELEVEQLKNKDNQNIQKIFQSEEFNSLSLEEFKKKFKNEPKLIKLKEIYIGIINGSFLNSNFFDWRGNKIVGWRINQIRGNFKYDAPKDGLE